MAHQNHSHEVGSSHGHSHHHVSEVTDQSHDERNLAHWNSVAKTYNSDHTQKEFGDLINKANAFVLANISSIGVDFLEPSSEFEVQESETRYTTIRVLDYACGPGTITNMLAGRASEFVGIDLSPNMVNEYNERFSNEKESENLRARAVTGNLFAPAGVPESLQGAEFYDFDLVAVGFGFHHFENLPIVTARLVERLKPGGVLMILDFYSHGKDDFKHAASNTISHHGFTETQVKDLFSGAGLKDVQVFDFGEDVRLKQHAVRRPFMARGTKPV